RIRGPWQSRPARFDRTPWRLASRRQCHPRLYIGNPLVVRPTPAALGTIRPDIVETKHGLRKCCQVVQVWSRETLRPRRHREHSEACIRLALLRVQVVARRTARHRQSRVNCESLPTKSLLDPCRRRLTPVSASTTAKHFSWPARQEVAAVSNDRI